MLALNESAVQQTKFHFMSHFFVSSAVRMFERRASQLWETSHVWSLIESEWESLLTMNISFYTAVESVVHFAVVLQKAALCYLSVRLLIRTRVPGLSNSWLEDWMMSTTSSMTAMRSRQSESTDVFWTSICADVLRGLCNSCCRRLDEH